MGYCTFGDYKTDMMECQVRNNMEFEKNTTFKLHFRRGLMFDLHVGGHLTVIGLRAPYTTVV